MFDFPPSTIVNRPIPKSKILERARPATPQVPEIQIFHLQLKGKELHPDLLHLLDKTIPQPILFTIESAERKLAHSAAHKRPSEADTSQWVVGSRFTSDFIPAEKLTRLPLPTALDLSRLYTALLAPLLPLSPRRAESLSDLIERCGAHQRLIREISQLTSRLHREKQFNRKVALNQELKPLKAELEKITNPV